MVDQKILGILFGVGAGMMWAVETILGKILFQSSTFIQVAAIKAFFTTITVSAYGISRRIPMRLDRKNTLNILIVGLVGTVFAPLMYFFGLTQTFALNAGVIAHLQPISVSFFGFYFLKERLHKKDFIADILIIFAAVLITSRTITNLIQFEIGNFGDFMVFFCRIKLGHIGDTWKAVDRENEKCNNSKL